MKALELIKVASSANSFKRVFGGMTSGEKFFGGTAAVLGIGGAVSQSRESKTLKPKTAKPPASTIGSKSSILNTQGY